MFFVVGPAHLREIEEPRAELEEEEQLEWALRLYLEGVILLFLTPTILSG